MRTPGRSPARCGRDRFCNQAGAVRRLPVGVPLSALFEMKPEKRHHSTRGSVGPPAFSFKYVHRGHYVLRLCTIQSADGVTDLDQARRYNARSQSSVATQGVVPARTKLLFHPGAGVTLAGDLQDRAPDAYASVLQGDQVDPFRNEVAPQQYGGAARACGGNSRLRPCPRARSASPGACPRRDPHSGHLRARLRATGAHFRPRLPFPRRADRSPIQTSRPGPTGPSSNRCRPDDGFNKCGSPECGAGDVGAIPPCPGQSVGHPGSIVRRDTGSAMLARMSDPVPLGALLAPCRKPQPRSYPGGAPHAPPRDGAGAGDRGRYGRTRPPVRLGPAPQPAIAADRRRS